MNKLQRFLFTIALVVFTLLLGAYIGRTEQQQRTESRAVHIGVKDCYTNADIEYIIFGDYQE